MRLRHVKGAQDLIDKHVDYIVNIERDETNILNERLKTPIHLEIGMGKGQFIYTHALNNPNIQYVGLEKFDSVIVRALEKMIENPLNNLYLVRADAIGLNNIFLPNSIERIYLNFSDPWPKAKHEKRRLTYRTFLTLYQGLLKPGGEIHFKTDNRSLYLYSLESIKDYGMEITLNTEDLHRLDVPNVMTEFEEKFKKQGKKIYKIIAHFKEDIDG
jgi:tRNA (guanine-N7-)-methyltransferase